jgi:hypothetical protein
MVVKARHFDELAAAVEVKTPGHCPELTFVVDLDSHKNAA